MGEQPPKLESIDLKLKRKTEQSDVEFVLGKPFGEKTVEKNIRIDEITSQIYETEAEVEKLKDNLAEEVSKEKIEELMQTITSLNAEKEKLEKDNDLTAKASGVSRFLSNRPQFEILKINHSWLDALRQLKDSIEKQDGDGLNTALNNLLTLTENALQTLPDDPKDPNGRQNAIHNVAIKNISDFLAALDTFNDSDIPWDGLREEFEI